MSEAVEDFDALKTEVKLKDKMLHAKEDELQTVKSEVGFYSLMYSLFFELCTRDLRAFLFTCVVQNEALKQQLQLLMTSKGKKAKVKYNDTDDKNFLKPDSPNINDGGSPSISPKPKVSRK